MSETNSSLSSKTVLGIIGSGQLARMTIQAASELGIESHVYCAEDEISPAEHVATKTIKGKFTDIDSILKFANDCDYITLENEFIDLSILEAIDLKYPNRLYPNSKTFKLIGDKISEKDNFKKIGINVAPYKSITSESEILEFAKIYNYPVILKSAKGGYDGYGNQTIKNAQEVNKKFKILKGELLVEAFIPYEVELATMVARNSNGEIVVYPIANTIQENHICLIVAVPAEISIEIQNEIIEISKKAMLAIDAIGVFAFEFFLTKDKTLYLNESAPRPHNSAHYSLEGCLTSQFHNHVRSVLNLPLGSSELRAPNVLMLNLLGTSHSPANLVNAKDFLQVQDGHLHLYGKKMSKIGRKMGHFTMLGSNKIKMFEILKKLKSEYRL